MDERRHDPVRVGWTCAALLVTVAPHVPRLPAWISLLTLSCLGWRLLAALRGWRPPWRWLRIGLAVAGFAGVTASYGTVNGLEAGTALLVVMMDMKVLETWRRRDFQVLIFIGWFLVLAQLLFEPSLWTLPWMIAAVWLSTTALLQSVRAGPPLAAGRAGGLALKALAVSTPLLLVLFLLFPRVPGPFWALPTRGGAGTTGLSEEMSPGSISALSRSDAVAFRASFDGSPPPPWLRYWRGPVMHDFDGATWRESGGFIYRDSGLVPEGSPLRYRMMLEPHDRPWLLALDYVDSWTAERAYRTWDYRLIARQPVEQLRAFDVVSYPGAVTGLDLSDWMRRMELRLPDDRNPRTRALALRLREEHPDDPGYVRAVLDHFTGQPYVYTLEPPALTGADPVDEFMFDTLRGFCEHFASAFTVMMRAAGVPARVVTGYQGGRLNPLDGRLVVRQSDAHAWSEVWLPDDGWTRVDPTAAVAPERIALSLADAVPEDDAVPGRLLRSLPLLERLRQGWDAMDAAWNEWVLGFGPERQLAMLRRLGISEPDWRALATGLGIGVLGALAGVAAWLAWRYRPPAVDPATRLYRRFLARLARCGVRRAPWEGPLAFGERAARARPRSAAEIMAITRSYVHLRYEPDPGPWEMDHLRRRVRRFDP